MVCCRPRHVELPCGNLGPGVFVFVVRPDQEEIGIIVALEIGVQEYFILEYFILSSKF